MALRINEQMVRMKMVERGIRTVEDLAERTGVTSLTIRTLFKGGDFRAVTLQKLSLALGCNPLDLLIVEEFPDPLVVAPAFSA